MIQQTYIDGEVVLQSSQCPSDLSLDWFDAGYWRERNRIIGKKAGRGNTWFFQHHQLQAVLRHYWRGGLIGNLLNDQYLYLGLPYTRMYREFAMLCHLHEMGLPVPTPIAAKISRNGLIYRGDIITQAIPGAVSLQDILSFRRFTHSEIEAIAMTIARFHNSGVDHADLNIKNILLDASGNVYLIDFDRGTLTRKNQQRQQKNILRLKRSFEKQLRSHTARNWTPNQWNSLMKFYHNHTYSSVISYIFNIPLIEHFGCLQWIMI